MRWNRGRKGSWKWLALYDDEVVERPRLTQEWACSLARSWCRLYRLPDRVADDLGEVFFRFRVRDAGSIERQLRFRGVMLPDGNTQVLDGFADYVNSGVREVGWAWVWEHGVMPPYPVGTVLRQGLIVGIDDLEPATYRVRPDGLPGDIRLPDRRGLLVCTTPLDRELVGSVPDHPQVILVPFEDASLPADDGVLVA